MKYRIVVQEIYVYDVEVEADDPIAARRLVEEEVCRVGCAAQVGSPEWQETLPAEYWPVYDENNEIVEQPKSWFE